MNFRADRLSGFFIWLTERDLALKFFSTLSGVKADKMDSLGLKINHDHTEGNYDGGRIEEALEALARWGCMQVNFKQTFMYSILKTNFTVCSVTIRIYSQLIILTTNYLYNLEIHCHFTIVS